jgi:transcriptional regulator with XRE-family HTH domain
MDRPGERLRRARERLKLTYRDVEQASHQVAARRGNSDFQISLSRLAAIENNGRTPTIYRLYSLCAIYHLDLQQVLDWYGVPAGRLTAEALEVPLPETHLLHAGANGHAGASISLPAEADYGKTTFLNHFLRDCGKVAFDFMEGTTRPPHCYGLVGLEDWSMFPILRPGSLVLIDDKRRRIARGGWTTEFNRPIYFLEHRDRFLCGWCTPGTGSLAVQPHPSSHKSPEIFQYPGEIEVIGQVTAVVMLLERPKTEQYPSNRDQITP